MPRFKLTIEYDGANYVGWQRQANGPSIQAALEDAAKAYCQIETLVEGAGRTDVSFRKVGRLKSNMILSTYCYVKRTTGLSCDFAIWQSYCPSRRVASSSGSRHVRSGSSASV